MEHPRNGLFFMPKHHKQHHAGNVQEDMCNLKKKEKERKIAYADRRDSVVGASDSFPHLTSVVKQPSDGFRVVVIMSPLNTYWD